MSDLKVRVWDGKRMYDHRGLVVLISEKTGRPCAYTDVRDVLEDREIGEDTGICEVMLWTGYTDAEGNPIWQGDIVRKPPKTYGNHPEINVVSATPSIGVVEWGWRVKPVREGRTRVQYGPGWEDERENVFYGWDGQEFRWEDLTVIGNIYEDKDLLLPESLDRITTETRLGDESS